MPTIHTAGNESLLTNRPSNLSRNVTGIGEFPEYHSPKGFIMELKDTVDKMLSSDYSERLQAEYDQATIRLKNLTEFLEKYEDDSTSVTLNCPVDMLYRTKFYLELYRDSLQNRLIFEKAL